MADATSNTVTVSFDPTAINRQTDILFPVTTAKAGILSSGQYAEILAELGIAVATDIVLFADSVNGSDANDGSVSAPVQTWTKLMSLCAATYTGKCELHLSGSFEITPETFLPRPIGPTATPPVFIGEFTDELGTVTETAGDPSGLVVTDGALALPVDAYRGAYIFCVSGANAGRRRIIVNNTATSLTVNVAFQSPISIGDTFVVERPAVTISDPPAARGNFMGQGTAVGLKGIILSSTVNGNGFRFVGCENVVCEGVELLDTDVQINSGVLVCASNPNRWVNAGLDNPFSTRRLQAGLFLNNSSVTPFASGSGTFGFMVGTVCLVEGITNTNVNLSSLDFLFGQIFLDDGSNGQILGGKIDGDAFGDPSLGLVTLSGGSKMAGDVFGTPGLGNLMLTNNSAGPGIRATQGSYVNADNVSGAANATYGIVVDNMSQVNTNGTCTVTGTVDDTLVGAVAKAYGALPFSEVDGSGPTLNRIQ